MVLRPSRVDRQCPARRDQPRPVCKWHTHALRPRAEQQQARDIGHRDENDTYDDFEPRSRHDDVSVHHFGVPYCGNTSTKSMVFFLPMNTTPKYVRGPIRRISSRIHFATSEVLE